MVAGECGPESHGRRDARLMTMGLVPVGFTGRARTGARREQSSKPRSPSREGKNERICYRSCASGGAGLLS